MAEAEESQVQAIYPSIYLPDGFQMNQAGLKVPDHLGTFLIGSIVG